MAKCQVNQPLTQGDLARGKVELEQTFAEMCEWDGTGDAAESRPSGDRRRRLLFSIWSALVLFVGNGARAQAISPGEAGPHGGESAPDLGDAFLNFVGAMIWLGFIVVPFGMICDAKGPLAKVGAFFGGLIPLGIAIALIYYGHLSWRGASFVMVAVFMVFAVIVLFLSRSK